MFEAKILQGATLKKIIEAIRELVVDANLDCTENGISMQVRTVPAIRCLHDLTYQLADDRRWTLPTSLFAR